MSNIQTCRHCGATFKASPHGKHRSLPRAQDSREQAQRSEGKDIRGDALRTLRPCPYDAAVRPLRILTMQSDREGNAMGAEVRRLAAASGNRDNDYFRAQCSCGWKGSPHSNRTVEGRRLAERDARNHRCVS